MKIRWLVLPLLLCGTAGAVDFLRMTANDGNLVMEDVPRVPLDVIEDLNRFQNVRSATMLDWSRDGQSIYVSTRFADVDQVHRVNIPHGARRQLTFFNDPVNAVRRRPGSDELLFILDSDGSEFTQIYRLMPDGSAKLVSDGRSRNTDPVWDRDGRRIAFSSTRRNGASNDIWTVIPDEPGSEQLVVNSDDGTWWGAVDFSASGSKLLLMNYTSIQDSSAYVLELDSGRHTEIAGGDKSSNFPVAFDADGKGVWLTSDEGTDHRKLIWQSLASDGDRIVVTDAIDWSVDEVVLDNNRQRAAFTTNEGGLSKLYLLDTKTHQYSNVNGIPVGVVRNLRFSPNDSELAMTINTPQSPSDTYVLGLGDAPRDYGELTRWTVSEVGGLDSSSFIKPTLVHYPTFDRDGDNKRQIPAWVYKPRGSGPHPVVISIHGGPEGQSRPVFSSTYQMWLEKLGVAVVLPNVRGSAGYGKRWLSLDNGDKRENAVRDIGALLDWIEEQPDLDSERVAVYGGSYGGYMVLASAVKYSSRLKAAVDVVGISNFVTFLENTQDYRRDLRRQEYGDERDPQMRRFLERISPLNNVKKIRVPMFVIQGQNDPRVPVTESEQMVAALRKQGLPVWYMNALNEGHGYKKKENRDIYQQAMVLFFRQYLVGEEQRDTKRPVAGNR